MPSQQFPTSIRSPTCSPTSNMNSPTCGHTIGEVQYTVRMAGPMSDRIIAPTTGAGEYRLTVLCKITPQDNHWRGRLSGAATFISKQSRDVAYWHLTDKRFQPWNVRFWTMLLKKSQIARRQFSCCKKSDPRPPNRCDLNRATEVASEFHLQAMRSPTFLHENRAYSQKKF